MTIIYNAKDHFGVIFSLHGSIWPAVLPWCCFNMLVATAVFYLRTHSVIDLTFNGGLGYQYISVLVSFFVVSNVNTTYNRYWEARGHLGKALNAAAMLATRAALYSIGDTSDRAREWRHILKLRLIELLETAMFVVQNERAGLINLMGPDADPATSNGGTFEKHGLRRSMYMPKQVTELETDKEPFKILVQVDGVILANGRYLKEPLDAPSRTDLLGRTSAFVDAWHDLLKFSTTPRPFVTVQMGRTIIFAWILFLPFAIVYNEKRKVLECIVLVFLVSYGFLGLTLAEIELHDPLGDDQNDLETSRYTSIVAEDIENYLGRDDLIQRLLDVAVQTDTAPCTNDYGSMSENDAGAESPMMKQIYGNRRIGPSPLQLGSVHIEEEVESGI